MGCRLGSGGAGGIVAALVILLILGACAPPLAEPVASLSQGIIQKAGQLRERGHAAVEPVGATPGREPASAVEPLVATPTAARPSPVVATAVPAATPAAVPTATLEEFWERYRALTHSPVLDHLAILPADRRDDPLFGINDALTMEDASTAILRGAGASIDRVEVRWDEVEPAPGVYQFERLDRLVQLAERWNYTILAVVDGAPAWAVERSTNVGAGPPRDLGAPPFRPDGTVNPLNPWAAFLATVARRYGSRIAAWEIWNEPNFRDFWHGSPAEYARLLQVARATLQVSAPGATVLVGGMVEDDGAFLQAVLATLCPRGSCASAPFDGVAWHVYGNPADVLAVTRLTRALLAPYHCTAPVWITEANVAVDDPRAPGDALVGPDAVSLSQQAAFVAQVYGLARAAEVRTVAIYRASDVDEDRHYWGLLRDDLSGRPSFFAYHTAARWLAHTRLVQLSHLPGAVTRVQLQSATQEVDVLWTDETRPVTVRIVAPFPHALLGGATGETQPIDAVGGVFSITLPPAPPRRPPTAPLAEPVYLIIPR